MQDQSDPDALLMLRVKQGDAEAFGCLVEKYKQPIVNLLARTLKDPSEAEDLAQNVFIQVYKSAHRYEISARFSTWIYTIARNLCLNEIRRRSRHPASSLEAASEEREEGVSYRQFEDLKTEAPGDSALREELEEKLAEAVSQLPEKQRLAILMCRQEELSYEEMAQILDCTLSATKSLIHRARETLKEKLKPYLRTGVWDKAEKL